MKRKDNIAGLTAIFKVIIMSMDSKIYNYIGKVLLVSLGVISTIWAFVEMFHIPASMPFIVLFAFGISATFMFLMNQKHKRIIMLCIGSFMLFLIILWRKILEMGIFGIANKVIQAFNEYFPEQAVNEFEIDYDRIKYMNTPSQLNTLLICVVLTGYVYILTTATYYKVFSSIHIILSLAFMCVGMAVGKLPSIVCMAVLMFYYLSCVIFRKNKTIYLKRMGLLAGFVTFITLMLLLIVNPGKYNGEKRYDKYKITMDKLSSAFNIDELTIKLNHLFTSEEVSQGGINGGKLGQVDHIKYSGDKLFNICMDRDSNNVYLKGFVGNRYEGESWTDMYSANYEQNDYATYALNNASGFEKVMSNDFDYIWDRKSDSYMKDIEITYVNASMDYTVYPYYSDIEIPHYMDGLIPESPENNVLEYQYFSLNTDEALGLFKLDDRESYEDTKFFMNKSMDVNANIDTLFSERLPENMVKFREYMSMYEGSYIKECIEEVRDYLKRKTTYTLNPGKLGEGKDYVESFLFEKRKGYCTAYASAATLMLRYYGIPARYVEGYVITQQDQENAKELDNGKIQVTLTDRAAHAWVEVYVAGVGFIPVEVTPGYYDTSENKNEDDNSYTTPAETEETSEKDTTEGQETSGKDEKETSTERTTDKSGKIVTEESKDKANDEKVTVIYGLILAIIVLMIVFVIMGKTNRSKRRAKYMDSHTDDMRHNVRILAVQLRKCMDKQKISYSKDRGLENIASELNRLIDRMQEIQESESGRKKKDSHVLIFPDKNDTIQVLWTIEKQKYSDENVKFTQEEVEKVRQYVENLKNSLQYFKNRL